MHSDLANEGSKHVAGGAVSRLLKDHLGGLDSSRPNKIGGKRTHYYADAARNVSYEVSGDGAEVKVHQIGIALHYYGGVIKPTGGRKYLTIPVDPEAYGRRAGEFNNLEIAWGLTKGGKPRPIGLVKKNDWAYKTKKNRKSGANEVVSASYEGGKWMFALVLSATIPEDKSILPEDDTIQAAAMSSITDYIISKMQGHS
ncbi:MAG: hypothetical protein WCS52_02365 [bacterium]